MDEAKEKFYHLLATINEVIETLDGADLDYDDLVVALSSVISSMTVAYGDHYSQEKIIMDLMSRIKPAHEILEKGQQKWIM